MSRKLLLIADLLLGLSLLAAPAEVTPTAEPTQAEEGEPTEAVEEETAPSGGD
jgi:hypothetical protein